MTSPEAALELRECLACLTPRQLEAVRLRAEGYKYREIAEKMGICHHSVQRLILRARNKIDFYTFEEGGGRKKT